MDDHPYLQPRRPPTPTAAMECALTQIASAVEAEYRGAGLHSLTRFGKTTLGRYILDHHQWFSQKYFAFAINIQLNAKLGEAARFYQQLQTGLKMAIFSRHLPEQKLARVLNAIVSRCHAEGALWTFLIVDEAQRLDTEAFEHLVTLDNELGDLGITLFVVFLFQDNYTSGLAEKANQFRVSPQVKARFLTRYHTMHGIRGEEDIKLFLHRLEEETEYPPASGISYPAHFAPEIYARGWRMEPSAGRLWDRGNVARLAAQLPDGQEWPMKAFEVMVFYLVTRVIRRPGFTDFSDTDLDEAVRFSDLTTFDGLPGKIAGV